MELRRANSPYSALPYPVVLDRERGLHQPARRASVSTLNHVILGVCVLSTLLLSSAIITGPSLISIPSITCIVLSSNRCQNTSTPRQKSIIFHPNNNQAELKRNKTCRHKKYLALALIVHFMINPFQYSCLLSRFP
jgi:hypothetical protein